MCEASISGVLCAISDHYTILQYFCQGYLCAERGLFEQVSSHSAMKHSVDN